MQKNEINQELLREKQVLNRIPVAHSTLWNWVRDGKFPSPIKLSEKVSVWKEADLNDWISSKSEQNNEPF